MTTTVSGMYCTCASTGHSIARADTQNLSRSGVLEKLRRRRVQDELLYKEQQLLLQLEADAHARMRREEEEIRLWHHTQARLKEEEHARQVRELAILSQRRQTRLEMERQKLNLASEEAQHAERIRGMDAQARQQDAELAEIVRERALQQEELEEIKRERHRLLLESTRLEEQQARYLGGRTSRLEGNAWIEQVRNRAEQSRIRDISAELHEPPLATEPDQSATAERLRMTQDKLRSLGRHGSLPPTCLSIGDAEASGEQDSSFGSACSVSDEHVHPATDGDDGACSVSDEHVHPAADGDDGSGRSYHGHFARRRYLPRRSQEEEELLIMLERRRLEKERAEWRLGSDDDVDPRMSRFNLPPADAQWREGLLSPGGSVHVDRLVDPSELAHEQLSKLQPELGIVLVKAAEFGGMEVAHVLHGKAGDRAGLEENDIILGIAGIPTRAHRAVKQALASIRAGSEVPLLVSRDGESYVVQCELGAVGLDHDDVQQLSALCDSPPPTWRRRSVNNSSMEQ